jgi:uncharacterized lipoprotein YddW (UPF0748 family)
MLRAFAAMLLVAWRVVLIALAFALPAQPAGSEPMSRPLHPGDSRANSAWLHEIIDAPNQKANVEDSVRFGRVLSMSNAGQQGVHLHANLEMRGGTLMFWVNPSWPTDFAESHTLLSGRWTDKSQSYFVISQGWWEPSGSSRLYFVASNEDVMHCSAEMKLPTGRWSLVTATWANGDHGFCRLYVDDQLVGETLRAWRNSATLTALSLGSDEFATNNRNRVAPEKLGDLQIFDRALTHQNIIARYRFSEDPSELRKKKWVWLEEGPLTPRQRDARQSLPVHFDEALFDEDMTWALNRASIDTRLERIKRAGFTVYVPCVWHGRGAAYPTIRAPEDSRLASRMPAEWDPLAYLILRAHTSGISVHPWVTVARREDEAHPEWAEPGTPAGAYDIHQPGFREFATTLLVDMVARYDIDGLNLDYIRTMGVCVSRFCQEDYRKRTGFDLIRDYSAGSPDESARKRIQGWQDEAVGSLVEAVSKRARAIKPAIIISVDGHVTRDDAQRPLEGRDEIDWANHNWVDAIYHMDYRSVVDTATVTAAKAKLNDPARLRLLVANYDLVDEDPIPRSGIWISRVLRYAKEQRGDSGIGVYLYSRLNQEQIRTLHDRPF